MQCTSQQQHLSLKPQAPDTTPQPCQRGSWLVKSTLVLLFLASSVLSLSAISLSEWRFLQHSGTETAASGYLFRKMQLSPWKVCFTFDVTNDTFLAMRGEHCYPLRSDARLAIPSPAASLKSPDTVATSVRISEGTICHSNGNYGLMLLAMGVPISQTENTMDTAVKMLKFVCGTGQQVAMVFHCFAAFVALTSLVWALALTVASQKPTMSSLRARLQRRAQVCVPLWCSLGSVLAAVGLLLWADASGQSGVSIKLKIGATITLGFATVLVLFVAAPQSVDRPETDEVDVSPRILQPLV